MTDGQKDEIKAVEAILNAMSELSVSQKQRVLKAVAILSGVADLS